MDRRMSEAETDQIQPRQRKAGLDGWWRHAMTVKELIDKLSEFDLRARVTICGGTVSGDPTDIESIYPCDADCSVVIE
jgi:hypothetical protein